MDTDTQTQPTLPDLRPLLFDAFAVADGLVATVTPADLDGPTPCEDFLVRGLVDVPDDAPAYDRLVGWMGRDSRWTPPADAAVQ